MFFRKFSELPRLRNSSNFDVCYLVLFIKSSKHRMKIGRACNLRKNWREKQNIILKIKHEETSFRTSSDLWAGILVSPAARITSTINPDSLIILNPSKARCECAEFLYGKCDEANEYPKQFSIVRRVVNLLLRNPIKFLTFVSEISLYRLLTLLRWLVEGWRWSIPQKHS